MLGTLLWEKGGLGSRYRGLGVSLEDRLSQALYRVSGEAEAVLPRAPADLAPRGAWLPNRVAPAPRSARREHADFGVPGPSVRGQALVWMPRGRAFTSSPVLCHRGYGRSCFPPPEEAQRRTGAVGGRWLVPCRLVGKTRRFAVPLSRGDAEVGGRLLAPSSSANTSPVHRTTGVRGGLSSRVGCMGRAVGSN